MQEQRGGQSGDRESIVAKLIDQPTPVIAIGATVFVIGGAIATYWSGLVGGEVTLENLTMMFAGAATAGGGAVCAILGSFISTTQRAGELPLEQPRRVAILGYLTMVVGGTSLIFAFAYTSGLIGALPAVGLSVLVGALALGIGLGGLVMVSRTDPSQNIPHRQP